MKEDDQLQTALLEWEAEGGSVSMPPPEPARASPPPPDRGLDMRVRRGSLGTSPVAPPLGSDASPAALHAHLVSLLDVSRDAAPRPIESSAAPDAEAEQRLTPHEDPERQPDGIPHLVIGLTALFSVLLAALLISMFRSGPTIGSVAAVILAIIAIPVLVSKLGAKAERDRDHVHPSR